MKGGNTEQEERGRKRLKKRRAVNREKGSDSLEY